jgi:hypothetical protein
MKLVVPNQRRFSRNQPPKEIEASLIVGGRAYSTAVVDYSLRGVGLRVPSSAVERSKIGDFGQIELELADQKYLGQIKHTKEEKFESVVGIDLRNDTSSAAISFTNADPGWDLIEDAETLATLFGDLVLKGPECQVDLRQLRFEGVVLPVKIENGVLTAELFSTKRGTIEVGTASFRFEIFQTCHAFDSKVLKVTEKSVEIELPKRVARLLRRETFRVLNGANGKSLSVKVASSLLGTHDHELRVYDYSEHGISVIDSTGWLAAPIGFGLEQITITTPDGKEI